MKISKHLKINLVIVLSLFISSNSLTQVFNIGHTSTVFYDNIRNRNIPTEIYYPADSNGNDLPLSSGNFPILVFGHGFLISWDTYENFWSVLVPEGKYMLITETDPKSARRLRPSLSI